MAAVFQPYGEIERASSIVNDEWLQRLENYFTEIVELYPIRPFDSNIKKIKGVGEMLIFRGAEGPTGREGQPPLVE